MIMRYGGATTETTDMCQEHDQDCDYIIIGEHSNCTQSASLRCLPLRPPVVLNIVWSLFWCQS